MRGRAAGQAKGLSYQGCYNSHGVPLPVEKQHPPLMRAMFRTVAPRYNFITRAFSYGMDIRWKRTCIALAQLPARAMVLDLAAGTGDFSALVVQKYPDARAIPVDLTE